MGEGNKMNVLKKNFSDECWKILLEYREATRRMSMNLRTGFICICLFGYRLVFSIRKCTFIKSAFQISG